MNTLSHKLCATLAVVFIGISFASLAASNDHDDDDCQEARLFKQAKISLITAIEIAEKSLRGKAISAEFENIHGTYNYSIELLLPNEGIAEIEVNASTGKLIENTH